MWVKTVIILLIICAIVRHNVVVVLRCQFVVTSYRYCSVGVIINITPLCAYVIHCTGVTSTRGMQQRDYHCSTFVK